MQIARHSPKRQLRHTRYLHAHAVPVVPARPAYAIKIAGQNGLLTFAGRAIKETSIFVPGSLSLCASHSRSSSFAFTANPLRFPLGLCLSKGLVQGNEVITRHITSVSLRDFMQNYARIANQRVPARSRDRLWGLPRDLTSMGRCE